MTAAKQGAVVFSELRSATACEHRLVWVRLGVVADIHGNDVALQAVLDDAAGCQVDRWWVLGDLVLFGPRPAEVLVLLRSVPGIEMLRETLTVTS